MKLQRFALPALLVALVVLLSSCNLIITIGLGSIKANIITEANVTMTITDGYDTETFGPSTSDTVFKMTPNTAYTIVVSGTTGGGETSRIYTTPAYGEVNIYGFYTLVGSSHILITQN